MMGKGNHFKPIILFSFFLLAAISHSLPLSTNKKWIVDAASGRRVKLVCVNWAAHLQPMIAEGLDKKPLKDIAAKVRETGFNCVRLTWATFMFTRPRYAKRTVGEALDSLNLTEAKSGIDRNNGFILNMTHVEAYEAVVGELGAQGILVVLDNHVSKPKWCCPYTDGNGFFGDSHFHPQEWLQGLIVVAKLFKGKSQVVAMSMRNELRGSRQNEHDWYQYIPKGAREVHKANPDVLVLVSGLTWGTDLSFLKKRPLGNLDDKLVYETHWYSFSGDSRIWEVQPLNRICADGIQTMNDRTAFVTDGPNPVPLFLGEFGVDQRGVNKADNRFLSCILAYAADRDLDWGLWALQGSYYYRPNGTGLEETFGVLDFHWDHLRNPQFPGRFMLLQTMIQDPNSKIPASHIMYHPQSGSCIMTNGKNEILAGNCGSWSHWSYNGDGSPIRLMGSDLCLKVVGDGHPPILSTDCLSQQSAWKSVSKSKLHLAAKDGGGELLCLHKKSSNSSMILTSRCVCIEDDSDCQKNPQSQWFKLVPTNIM